MTANPPEPLIALLLTYRGGERFDELAGELRLVARQHGIDLENVTRLLNGPLSWVSGFWEDDPQPPSVVEWCAENYARKQKRWGRGRRGRLTGRGLELVRHWARDRHGLVVPERPGVARCAHCGQTIRQNGTASSSRRT